MAKLLPRAVLSIAIFAATVSAAPPAQPDPLQVPDPLQAKVDAIRDRFVAAARACGLKPAFVPKVVLETGPAVISYEGTSQSLHIGRYEALPPPIQSFVTAWARMTCRAKARPSCSTRCSTPSSSATNSATGSTT